MSNLYNPTKCGSANVIIKCDSKLRQRDKQIISHSVKQKCLPSKHRDVLMSWPSVRGKKPTKLRVASSFKTFGDSVIWSNVHRVVAQVVAEHI